MLPAILLRADDPKNQCAIDAETSMQALIQIEVAKQRAKEYAERDEPPPGAPKYGMWTWKFTRTSGCESVLIWSKPKTVYVKGDKAWDVDGHRVKILGAYGDPILSGLLILGMVLCPCVSLPVGLVRGCTNWRASVD